MYSDLYIKKDDLEGSLDHATGKEADLLVKQLNSINGILEENEVASTDPLIDKWEKELEEGKIPNLDER